MIIPALQQENKTVVSQEPKLRKLFKVEFWKVVNREFLGNKNTKRGIYSDEVVAFDELDALETTVRKHGLLPCPMTFEGKPLGQAYLDYLDIKSGYDHVERIKPLENETSLVPFAIKPRLAELAPMLGKLNLSKPHKAPVHILRREALRQQRQQQKELVSL